MINVLNITITGPWIFILLYDHILSTINVLQWSYTLN